MKNRLTLFIFMALVWHNIAWSHHIIQGTVIGAEDQSPLLGAVIQNITEQRTSISDETGHFELIIDKQEVEILVSFMGFESKSLKVQDHDSKLTIVLEPAALELSQVKIDASQINQLSSLSKIDIRLRPTNSSQDVLRIIPGLFIAQHAGGGKSEQIFLRGFDIDHGTDINLTVDGMPVNMVSHAHGQGYADLHFLIPELISTVDFGKGPYYSSKGNLTTAGYAAFRTHNRLKQNQVKLEAGDFNTLRTLGMFNLLSNDLIKKGHYAYMAAEYLQTDGPFISPQNFNRINIFGKYTGYLSDKTWLSFQLSNLRSKWDASGQIPNRAVQSGEIDRFGAIDDTEGGYTGRTNASLMVNKKLDNGVESENQIFFSRYNFELYSNFTFFLNDPVYGDQIRQKENRDIYGFQGSLSKSIHPGRNLLKGKLGYGFRYDDINDLELSGTINRKETLDRKSLGEVDELNSWIFLDGELKRAKWLINFGLRGDYFRFSYLNNLDTVYSNKSVDKGILSPKLNVVYNINQNLKLFLKSGRSFHSNDSRVVTAENGEKILPAAYGADLGISLKPFPALYVNLAAWYLFLEQEFVYVGDEAIVEPSGKSERKGIDVSARWQVLPWLFADCDFNYAHTRSPKEPEVENHIPLAPIITSVGGFNLITQKGFSGSIRYRYMTDRPANEDYTITAPGYLILDLNANYSFEHLEFGIGIENLLNTEWNEAQFATLSQLKDEAQAVEELHYTPGVPFFAKLTVAYKF